MHFARKQFGLLILSIVSNVPFHKFLLLALLFLLLLEAYFVGFFLTSYFVFF